MRPDRRRVLKALGWAAAGLVVVAGGSAVVAFPALPYRAAPTSADAAVWLRLTEDGHIELVLPRSEMGQGVAIALRQILAAASGVPISRFRAIHPRTDRLPPTKATVGSDSIRDFAPLLWRAGTALAGALRTAGINPAAPPGAGWRALARSGPFIDADAIEAVSPADNLTSSTGGWIGMALPTDAIETIVTAAGPLYVDDVRLPDMAFAMMLPIDPDEQTASAVIGRLATMPGIVDVVTIERLVLVIGQTRGAVERAIESAGPSAAAPANNADSIADRIDIDALPAGSRPEHSVIEEGAGGPFDLELRLEVPMAAHAAMEPRCAVARPEAGGRIAVFAGTQDGTFTQARVAEATGRRREDVTVIGCRVGGGFGLKTVPIVETLAALAADRIRRPVKAFFNRADEFRVGFHRPPSSHRIRVRLGADGRIAAWQHHFRSGHVIFTDAAMGPALRFATSFVPDPGVERGSLPPYDLGVRTIAFEDVRLPVPTGPWRGLGAAPNVWAIETAIDAAARLRNEDPVDFRLRHLPASEARLSACLVAVAKAAGWPERSSGNSVGYGIACGVYKAMAHAAVVAECRRSGDGVRVTRLWCVQDSGRIINPDQARAQVEGNLVFGIGMALHEELTAAGGEVEQSSFADYTIPRFSDVPPMMITFIGEDRPPSGVGETAIVAATAAITNAIADLTGRPVTRLPWRAG